MVHSFTRLKVVGIILLIAVIIGIVYYLLPGIIRNRIPIVLAGIILVVIYLVLSGKISTWRKKYREKTVDHRKMRIKNGIDGVSKHIHSHLDHVDASEAVRLTADSYRYLDEGDFKQAIESIKTAKALVDSTLESVSAEARDLEVRADTQFHAKKYADAKELWSQSLAIYDEAERFARHTHDTGIVETITKTKEAIRGRIRESEVALDRCELVKYVETGDQMVASADKNYRARKFDDARSNYEQAKEHFVRALAFADEKRLTEDQPGIKKKIARVDTGIESVILGKTHALINEGAVCSGNRKYLVAENYYLLAIRLLEENAVKNTDAASPFKDARRGLVTARLEQAKEKMREADLFYAKGRYLEAKEEYELARDHLKETAEMASRYKLSALHAVLVRLGETCTENSEVATAVLMDVGIVSPAIVPVDSLEHIQPAPVRLVRSKPILPGQSPHTMTSPDALPPELTGIYPEWNYIGKGGFARVFRAKRTDGTPVVVKIPIFLDTLTGKTFIAEMQTWKKLSHTNIVKLYDFNIMPIPYLEEEPCDNALADVKKPVEPEEAAWILFNICEGLKFAHAQKIVHRDLKPENILIKDGIPKISDWGLSRVLTDMTVATSLAFTLTYAAPEQINNGVKDERTDIWQLGVILYELLTGELPFSGGSMLGIRKDITTKDPKVPGEIQHEAQVLDPVVMKCLNKTPSERYQSVAELQHALAKFLQITYTESLKISTTAHDYSRSAHLTGALVLTHLRTGDLANSYNYLQDLIHYAHGNAKENARELSEQIEIRLEMGLSEIPEELIQKAESVVHEIDIGFAGTQ
ncbi:MAG: protein kinase [Methanoregula sp.]|nr:protein kinase [Methanoregula sp.]